MFFYFLVISYKIMIEKEGFLGKSLSSKKKTAHHKENIEKRWSN